jgi:hypothetical protein
LWAVFLLKNAHLVVSTLTRPLVLRSLLPTNLQYGTIHTFKVASSDDLQTWRDEWLDSATRGFARGRLIYLPVSLH